MKRHGNSPSVQQKIFTKQWTQVRRDVVSHELGHWLVARALQFKTGGISITIHQQGFGSPIQDGHATVFPAPVITSADELRSYLEDRICILYGGLAGQVHNQELTPDELGEIQMRDASSDIRTIKELLPMLRGIHYGPEADATTSEVQFNEVIAPIWLRAQHLVDQAYPKLEWMREQLEPKVERPNITYTFDKDDLEALEHQFIG